MIHHDTSWYIIDDQVPKSRNATRFWGSHPHPHGKVDYTADALSDASFSVQSAGPGRRKWELVTQEEDSDFPLGYWITLGYLLISSCGRVYSIGFIHVLNKKKKTTKGKSSPHICHCSFHFDPFERSSHGGSWHMLAACLRTLRTKGRHPTKAEKMLHQGASPFQTDSRQQTQMPDSHKPLLKHQWWGLEQLSSVCVAHFESVHWSGLSADSNLCQTISGKLPTFDVFLCHFPHQHSNFIQPDPGIRRPRDPRGWKASGFPSTQTYAGNWIRIRRPPCSPEIRWHPNGKTMSKLLYVPWIKLDQVGSSTCDFVCLYQLPLQHFEQRYIFSSLCNL